MSLTDCFCERVAVSVSGLLLNDGPLRIESQDLLRSQNIQIWSGITC